MGVSGEVATRCRIRPLIEVGAAEGGMARVVG